MVKKGKKGPHITPLADRILIKPLEDKDKEKRSAAGIILPTLTSEDKVDRGHVIAVGPGRIDTSGKLITPKVKVGDTVLFQWGDKVSIDGETYYIVSESSVLAVTK